MKNSLPLDTLVAIMEDSITKIHGIEYLLMHQWVCVLIVGESYMVLCTQDGW